VRIDASHRSLNAFFGPEKLPEASLNVFFTSGNFFSMSLFFFRLNRKFLAPFGRFTPEIEKNEIPSAKHIYTSVAVPLWSQNFQKRPLNHRVGTLHAKGAE
jgi:hypothetical protein